MLWYNEPKTWIAAGDAITVTADHDTNFWRKTHYGFIRDNGHFYYQEVRGDFCCEVKVSGRYFSEKPGFSPTPRLHARKEIGVIEVGTVTTLRGVPPAAWEYRLGTYSALEWVLERHKERTPKDPTIRDKFNTYRFADHKEPVIELLRRVTTVSVETMKIVREMPK